MTNDSSFHLTGNRFHMEKEEHFLSSKYTILDFNHNSSNSISSTRCQSHSVPGTLESGLDQMQTWQTESDLIKDISYKANSLSVRISLKAKVQKRVWHYETQPVTGFVVGTGKTGKQRGELMDLKLRERQHNETQVEHIRAGRTERGKRTKEGSLNQDKTHELRYVQIK